MAGHECYHCKQWVEEGEAHDCWTTTEAALTEGLSEDLQDAWERLREAAAEFGEQRIYASHHSIMFARKACYCFVRPKSKYLELVIFLGREVKGPQVRRVERSSKKKAAHMLRITHRDEVEPPITDWMREAYDFASPAADVGRVQKKAADSRQPKPAKAAARRKPAPKKSAADSRKAPPRKAGRKSGRKR